jgi:hypothetical protein
VRAVFAGDAGRPGVASDPAYVTVQPQITLTATPSTLPAGGSVSLRGTVSPAKRRVTVVAYLQRPDGSERRVATRAASARSGRYRALIPLARAGSYRLATRAGADGASAAGSSPRVAVEVTPAG